MSGTCRATYVPSEYYISDRISPVKNRTTSPIQFSDQQCKAIAKGVTIRILGGGVGLEIF